MQRLKTAPWWASCAIRYATVPTLAYRLLPRNHPLPRVAQLCILHAQAQPEDKRPRNRGNIQINRLSRIASITGVAIFIVAANANGDTTYSTSAGSGFNGTGSLTLASSSGDDATLVFTPDSDTTAIPNNIDYGGFTISCPDCGSIDGGTGATFSPFYFDLVVDDDGAIGTFVGESTTTQTIYSDSSTMMIDWQPLQLGPGTSDATTGNFGSEVFTITSPTDILAPDSGSTIVSGQVTDPAPAPEPPTTLLGLVGGVMIFLGLRRGGRSRV